MSEFHLFGKKKEAPKDSLGGSAGTRNVVFNMGTRTSSRLAAYEAELKKRSSYNELYPKSILSDPDRRTKPWQLEDMFALEPVIHAAGTSWQSLINETGFKIWSSNEETNKEIQRILTKTNFNEVFLKFNSLHLFVFGRYFSEPLWDADSGSEIVAFNPVNPIYIDFIRDASTNSVIFDEYGIEAGFKQDMEDGRTPKEWKRTNILHGHMFQVNRGQMGIGFVEPIYLDTELKENIEQARSAEAYARANRIPLVEYGSEIFKADASLKKRAEEFAQSLVDPETEWAAYSGQEMKIHWLEPPKVEAEMINQLLYSTRLQAAVLKIPVSILLRSNIDGAGGTLEDILDFFEYDFKAFQEALRIKDQIINIIKMENEKREANKIPIDEASITIEYGKLSQKSIKEIVMRVMRMGKAGLLDPEDPDVNNWIKGQLGIPKGTGQIPTKDSKGVMK